MEIISLENYNYGGPGKWIVAFLKNSVPLHFL